MKSICMKCRIELQCMEGPEFLSQGNEGISYLTPQKENLIIAD